MVTKKPKGLGRGLEALLGPKVSEAADSVDSSLTSPGLPASLRLSDMVAGQYQPRTRMDEVRCTSWPSPSKRRASCSQFWCVA